MKLLFDQGRSWVENRPLGLINFSPHEAFTIAFQVDKKMKYTVRVEENSHYADESARYTLGEFVDAEVAVCAARKVVDEDLNSLYRPGMTTDELYRQYVSFGHDAYIISDDRNCRFSARDYARERCQQICSQPPHTEHTPDHRLC